MSVSDWLAVIALIISSGALFLEIRRWIESGPNLKLSIIADAQMIPDDDGRPKLLLIVTNRGDTPTTLTNMIVFGYSNWWSKLRGKPSFSAIIPHPNPNGYGGLPKELKTNETWMGMVYYRDKIDDFRKKGLLSVGVVSSHSDTNFLISVPREKPTSTPLTPLE